MLVAHTTKELNLNAPIVTMGFFDGVHAGHTHIIKRVVKLAHQTDSPSLVVTFWPHPRHVLQSKDAEPKLLSTLHEKIEIIRSLKIDALLVLNFNEILANLSAEDFIKQIIVKGINASHIVVGQKHFFGRNGEGNYNLLQSAAKEFGFKTELTDPITMGGTEVRSSLIRRTLLEGDLHIANSMLMRNYQIPGVVEGGMRLGTSIGFPTANITVDLQQKLIPGNGVYAGWVHVMGRKYPSMLNIGVRPTVAPNQTRNIEAHIIGFNGDIYNKPIRVDLVERIRDEVKFPSIKHLKAQLATDREDALAILMG